MKIPAHQIQNVLRLYFRQLGEGKILEKSGKFVMSSEGARRSIIDNVAAGIVHRIITRAGHPAPEDRVSGRQAPSSDRTSDRSKDKSQFTYLLVDRHNQEKIQTARHIQPQRDHSDMGD
jgi:hypothetical protein